MNSRVQWLKERWIELRIGNSSYFAYALAFFNLVILVSLRFDVTGVNFFLLALGISTGVSSAGIVLGHLHLKHQQSTDLEKEFRWQIDETAKAVIKKLKDENLLR